MADAITPLSKRRRWVEANAEGKRDLIVEMAIQLMKRRAEISISMRALAYALDTPVMTMYTYIDGQDELRLLIIRKGFEMLGESCQEASTLGTTKGWLGGARQYLQFALDNPSLYQLMFAESIPKKELKRVFSSGYQPLLDRVREQMLINLGRDPRKSKKKSKASTTMEKRARKSAGRFWIALHGLASLAIAERLTVLEGDIDTVLEDLLKHVAPT